MGLKENVEAIKNELSAEEQFLESVIKAEGFFKKYKKLLIALAVIIFVGIVAYLVIEYKTNHDLKVSNAAYASLQKDPADHEALATLKDKNPGLYALFLFSQEVKSGDVQKLKTLQSTLHDPILKDLADYQSGVLQKDTKQLAEYAQNQDALLADMAKLDEGFLLFQEGKGKEARAVLAQISVTSSLHQIAQNFAHFQK